MKIRLLIVILISAGFFLMVSSYTNHQNGQGREEKEYQFLTQDFLSALEKLNSDAFFQSSQNDFKKRQLSYVRAIHYEKVAQKLCEDISDTFLEILDNEITDHNIFYLTNELNSALEKKGGYILPLHSTQGYLNATYFNQDWDKNSTGVGGHRKFTNAYYQDFSEKERNRTSAAIREGGIIEVDTDPNRIEWYRRYRTFKKYALEVHNMELRKEVFVLDMVQPYLLIFPQDAKDITQDMVYLYLEFPYRITGSDLINPTKIVLRDRKTGSACRIRTGKDCIKDERYEPEVKCHARSTNLMKAQAADQIRYKEHKAVAMVLGGSPLGYPISEKFISGDAYQLERGEFAEPSLKCWLKIMSDDKSNIESCVSPAYADKFLSMINRDVCLRKTETTSIPSQTFPMTFPYGGPAYLVTQFNPRCDP